MQFKQGELVILLLGGKIKITFLIFILILKFFLFVFFPFLLQLTYCLIQFLEKDPTLTEPVLSPSPRPFRAPISTR